MAHTLRYYKEIEQPNYSVRLEIYAKNSEAPAVEIGDVMQQLSLEIQGQQEDIDAPIVKTSLTMTFVDAPDLEDGKKCGNWEEFYTSDSTKWKVLLKAKKPYGAYTTIWGGYITPDSYSEEISYRGPVTIIARDNIGHMQDFPFDMEGNAEGMVTLQQLVNEAWAKIESPMSLDWRHEADDAMYLICDGVEAPQTYMNVSAFEDMNYFDAVEKALYSYGLVMRYTGSNRVTIMSLRDLPYQGKSSAPRAIEPTFLAHAQRELAPAVRRIEESVKYEDVEAVQPQVKPSDFSGVSDHYAYEFGHPSGATLETAPVHNIINTDERNGWANMPGKTLFFNAGLYELSNFDKIQPYADIMHRYMYIAVNNVQNISLDNVERFVSYGRNMLYQDFGFSLNLGILIEWSGALVLSKVSGYTLSGITYAVGCEYEGDIIYYAGDGKWQDSVCEITQEISGNEENNTIDISVLVDRTKSYKTATFILYIRRISYTRQGDLASGRGLYAAVQSLSITHNNALLSDNTVNTVYNNDNNVIISREPEIAPALNSVILPSVIKNGIFVKSGNAYLPAKGWAWSGGTPQQMAVYNHLQLLCYHSKPNNIISGDIAYADFVDMAAIYEWGGANHLLVSGSYNFLNGRIESAVLREFKFYAEMWSDVSGASLPDTEQNNRTTAESGSGAAKASTYSNETTVNIGGSGGGGGTGGSSTLAGLLDVQVSSPSNGQALVYDSASGMWMNKTIEKGDKVTSSTIIAALGYTPFNAANFTKANIKSTLEISDWALAASKPSYTWTEIGSKPTTLSGYGITDGLVYSDYINLDSAYRHIGYGYNSIGWKTSGPAAVFGTALYNLRMQCAISTADTPLLYISQMYNGEAKGWAELVTYEGVKDRAFYARLYYIGDSAVLHRSGNDTFLNSGNSTIGNLQLYGTSLYFTLNGSSVPFKILADGKVHIAEVPLTKGTSNSLKAGAYEALNYFADGKLIMHRNAGAENFFLNYGGAAEPMYLYGSTYSFHIGASRERVFSIFSNKDASFAASLTVAGAMYSKNLPQGKTFYQDPTSSFISTIFDTDAVGDSVFRMRVTMAGTKYDGICSPYSTMLVVKSTDTHGFISFGYNDAGRTHCYIGGGNADKINWSGILFHDNMDLIPKDDGAFSLGYSDKRWRTLNAVNVSANGLFGYVPNGGTYQQYRVFYEGDKLYIQVGSQDGLSAVGKLTICGIYSATLQDFTIYSQLTSFSGAVKVSGTSQFVSLATFDNGLKIGDATLTWDAAAGMLKIDKGVYSEGAITAKKKA